MRAVHVNTGANDRQSPEMKPLTAARRRPGPGRSRAGPRSRLRGLRWVPIPLAVLAAVIGALVMGSFRGQEAAANANQTGYRAGGLALSVEQMLWMSADMNDGPAAKTHINSNGFQMPGSMMPGMQKAGDSRLRIEVVLQNTSRSVQRYASSDFRVVAPGGRSWKPYTSAENTVPSSAALEPAFQAMIDVYFDIPTKQAKNLSIKWSRGGTTVFIPVNTGGTMPRGMHM